MIKIREFISKHKKIVIASVVVVIMFLIVNCLWVINYKISFGDYETITKDDRFPGVKISLRDEKTYSISKLYYLRFKNNLGISDSIDKNSLIIWISWKEPSFGFTMSENENVYEFKIDKDGNLINENDEYSELDKSVYENNRHKALALLDDYNKWTEAAKNADRTFFDEETRGGSSEA